MFGYISINRPELKVKELDEYMSFYCGLCHSLRGQFGVRGQLSLSYDLTFLEMLLTGLYEPETTQTRCKCIFHPMEKRWKKENACMEYVADMNLLLTYLKCQDDWKDEKKTSRLLYGAAIQKNYRELVQKYPGKAERLKQQFEMLDRAEQRNSEDIDLLSGCFGRILAEIFVYREDEWKPIMQQIGFMLGKFVYIMDAYEDVEKDEKNHCFNPFIVKCKTEGFDDWVKDVLTLTASSCAREFEKLPIILDVEILRNILYSGIWTRYEQVREKRTAESKEKGTAVSKEKRTAVSK